MRCLSHGYGSRCVLLSCITYDAQETMKARRASKTTCSFTATDGFSKQHRLEMKLVLNRTRRRMSPALLTHVYVLLCITGHGQQHHPERYEFAGLSRATRCATELITFPQSGKLPPASAALEILPPIRISEAKQILFRTDALREAQE